VSGTTNPDDDVPADAKNLPLDCQDILWNSGVTAGFKASTSNTDEYYVSLKLSADAKDAADLLTLPFMKGVKTIQTYSHEYERGFTAKLNYEQVCSLDKEARVSYVQVCIKKLCVPETAPAKPVPTPSKNSGIKGAPDITGLSDQCARVVWYTITEFNPLTLEADRYDALTKIWVSQKDADAFFLGQTGIIRNETWEKDGWYSGKWTYAQLCEIEKSPLVSRIETVSLVPLPKGSTPAPTGNAPVSGAKGKGTKA